jgi:hypothetical protein
MLNKMLKERLPGINSQGQPFFFIVGDDGIVYWQVGCIRCNSGNENF